MLYLCMSMESGGKREFIFPASAFEKYGVAVSSARRYIEELADGGFIVVKSSGKCTRTANIYEFCFNWLK